MFDAIAILLSTAGATALSREAAAVDFLRDAYGHLKAICLDEGAMELLKTAGIKQDAGVIEFNALGDFVEAAKSRCWEREASIRTLA
jgi:catalase